MLVWDWAHNIYYGTFQYDVTTHYSSNIFCFIGLNCDKKSLCVMIQAGCLHLCCWLGLMSQEVCVKGFPVSIVPQRGSSKPGVIPGLNMNQHTHTSTVRSSFLTVLDNSITDIWMGNVYLMILSLSYGIACQYLYNIRSLGIWFVWDETIMICCLKTWYNHGF